MSERVFDLSKQRRFSFEPHWPVPNTLTIMDGDRVVARYVSADSRLDAEAAAYWKGVYDGVTHPMMRRKGRQDLANELADELGLDLGFSVNRDYLVRLLENDR